MSVEVTVLHRAASAGGANTHASYYRLGVGRRTGQTRRRRGRRRGRRAAGPPDTAKRSTTTSTSRADGRAVDQSDAGRSPRRAEPDGRPKPHKPRGSRRGPDRLRTVHETSAGGLVIDGIDGPKDSQVAALIGRVDRRGRMLWSLPKGHIELGETAEQTAIREVAEETGIQGSVLAALGSIDYWFVTEGRRVHKTVHHYLMRFLGGELSDEDVEVSEVAWVPLTELPSRLAYADERKLAEVADELIDKLHTRRAVSAAAAAPHLTAPACSDALPHPHPPSRRNGPAQAADERLRTRAVTARRGSGTVTARLFAVLVGLILIVAPTVSPHAAAGEPGSTAVPSGAYRPRHARGGDDHQRARRHRDRHGAQRRRPPRPRCDGPPRARRRRRLLAQAFGRTSAVTNDQFEAGGRLHHRVNGIAARPERSVHVWSVPLRVAAGAVARHRQHRASTRFSSTPTARPTTVRLPASTMPASCCR